MMKYRNYCFKYGRLIGIWVSPKLPNKAKKIRNLNVWSTNEIDGIWIKVCLNNSDIDFGTGVKVPNIEMPIEGKTLVKKVK